MAIKREKSENVGEKYIKKFYKINVKIEVWKRIKWRKTWENRSKNIISNNW